MNEWASYCRCFAVVIFSQMIHWDVYLHLWPLIGIIFDHRYPVKGYHCNLTSKHPLPWLWNILVMNHLSSWSCRGEREKERYLFLFPLLWQLNLDSVKLHKFYAFFARCNFKRTHTFQLFLYKHSLFDVNTQQSLHRNISSRYIRKSAFPFNALKKYSLPA